MTPEESARQAIDGQLAAADLVVQDKSATNLSARASRHRPNYGDTPPLLHSEWRRGLGRGGRLCYLLYVDAKAIGTVEAKPKNLPAWRDPLPFRYESTGVETYFTNNLDPQPRARNVFSFHRPETLLEWIVEAASRRFSVKIDGQLRTVDSTLNTRLKQLPPLIPNVEQASRLPPQILWDAQVKAITNLEKSLAENRPRALIHLAELAQVLPLAFLPPLPNTAAMRQRIAVAFALFFLTILAFVIWQACGFGEPRYHGRSLFSWLQDLDHDHPNPKDAQAREAIRHIGPAAMPQLIKLLRSRGFWNLTVTQRWLRWAGQHHLTKPIDLSNATNLRRAVEACIALGPEARPAIPELTALWNEGHAIYNLRAGTALADIGPDTAIPLVNAMTNQNVSLRVMMALSGYPSNNQVIVSTLAQRLQDKPTNCHFSIVMILAQTNWDPTIAVPALVGALSDPDISVRWHAGLALGEHGPRAQAASPALLNALTDPDRRVQVSAAIALARLHPKDPATVEKVLPLLIEPLQAFRDPKAKLGRNIQLVAAAMPALEDCGPLARSAAPALHEYLNDQDEELRKAAAQCLRAVDP